MGMLGACFIKIWLDPAYFNFFFNGACAVRENIPVRMLENPPENVIAFDVNINYVQPYSRTTYANDVKFQNSARERRPYLTLATPHIAGVTIRRKKPNVNNVKKCAGRTYISELAYLPN